MGHTGKGRLVVPLQWDSQILATCSGDLATSSRPLAPWSCSAQCWPLPRKQHQPANQTVYGQTVMVSLAAEGQLHQPNLCQCYSFHVGRPGDHIVGYQGHKHTTWLVCVGLTTLSSGFFYCYDADQRWKVYVYLFFKKFSNHWSLLKWLHSLILYFFDLLHDYLIPTTNFY